MRLLDVDLRALERKDPRTLGRSSAWAFGPEQRLLVTWPRTQGLVEHLVKVIKAPSAGGDGVAGRMVTAILGDTAEPSYEEFRHIYWSAPPELRRGAVGQAIFGPLAVPIRSGVHEEVSLHELAEACHKALDIHHARELYAAYGGRRPPGWGGRKEETTMMRAIHMMPSSIHSVRSRAVSRQQSTAGGSSRASGRSSSRSPPKRAGSKQAARPAPPRGRAVSSTAVQPQRKSHAGTMGM